MEVRKSRAEDCRGVYALVCELERQNFDYEAFAAIYIRQQEDERYCCLVCEADGEVVGLLNLRFEEQLHHAGRVAEVLEFVVLPAYRGRGIGREMVTAAEHLARARGCGLMEVASGRQRTAAHRFYEREGFAGSHYKFTKRLLDE